MHASHHHATAIDLRSVSSSRNPIEALILISPCIYCPKPLLIRGVEACAPRLVYKLMRSIPLLHGIPRNEYLNNLRRAFSTEEHEGRKKKKRSSVEASSSDGRRDSERSFSVAKGPYRYQDSYVAARHWNKALLSQHPQAKTPRLVI